jgi:hypothetical protein
LGEGYGRSRLIQHDAFQPHSLKSCLRWSKGVCVEGRDDGSKDGEENLRDFFSSHPSSSQLKFDPGLLCSYIIKPSRIKDG